MATEPPAKPWVRGSASLNLNCHPSRGKDGHSHCLAEIVRCLHGDACEKAEPGRRLGFNLQKLTKKLLHVTTSPLSAISTHLPQSSLHLWGSSINCSGPEQKGTIYLLALASVFYSWGVGLWAETWETIKFPLTSAWLHPDTNKAHPP